MITCETCGEVMPDGTQFCSNCGAPTTGGKAAQPDSDAIASAIPSESVEPILREPECDVENVSVDSAVPPQAQTNHTSAPVQNPFVMPEQSQNIPSQQQTYTQSQQSYGQPQKYNQPQQTYGQPQNYNQPQQSYGQPQNYGQSQQSYSQPQNYNQPQQYGQPTYNSYGQPSYMQPKQTDGKAVCSLIMGILSLLLSCAYGCGLIFSIIGIIFGAISKKDAERNNPMSQNSSGMAMGGIVCSVIGGILSLLMLIFIIIAVAASVSDNSSYYGY